MYEEMKQQVLAGIDAREAEYRKLWEEIVRCESSSFEKDGVDGVAAVLQRKMDEMGLLVSRHHYEKAGDSLSAKTAYRPKEAGDRAGSGAVLLMGHMDTVHKKGSFGADTFRVEEEAGGTFVHGPGVFDCKGGIAAALLAAKALLDAGYTERELRFVFSGDEEVGHSLSEGAGVRVYEEMARGAAAGFNAESALMNGDVITGRKGGTTYNVTVHGVAAHAGREPKNGASAIKEMARKILAIEALTDYEDVTCNCGVISGGTVSNSIPAECSMEIDVRYRTQEGRRRADTEIRRIVAEQGDPRITAEVSQGPTFAPMEKTEGTGAFFALYQESCAELGFGLPQEQYTGGCSDAAWVTALGVPVICGCGVRGSDNHSPAEKALLSSLGEQAKKIALTILKLS